MSDHGDIPASVLLPCPFCGSDAISGYQGNDDGGYHYVECSNPIFNSSHFCGFHTDSADEAIRLWNSRAYLNSASVWQDIASAPKDGTTIFGAHNKLGQRGMVHFNGTEWEMVDGLTNLPMGVGFYPTHWMPMPPKPPYTTGGAPC